MESTAGLKNYAKNSALWFCKVFSLNYVIIEINQKQVY